MITPIQLKKLFPMCRDPNVWCRIFTMELPAFGILENDARLAAWLAQCGYESQSFNTLRESGSYGRVTKNDAGATVYDLYSEKRLMEIWPSKFPTLASTQPYIQQPEALMNYVYANVLGNGPTFSRDGMIYRGGGLIQITGRANYRAVGMGLNLNLESQPKLIEQPNVACRVAGYFWKIHDLNAAADAGDFDHITKKITGSMTGAAERTKYWIAAKAILAVPAMVKGTPPGPAPNQPPKVQTTPGTPPGSVPAGTLDGVMNPLAA
jgi:putative chitinase